jgi:hypothetical protein
MISVGSGTEILFASIAGPQSASPAAALPATLVAFDGKYAEVSLRGATELSQGSLVKIQTSEILYLGEIESGWTEDGNSHMRILIEHSVDLARAASIRQLWNANAYKS